MHVGSTFLLRLRLILVGFWLGLHWALCSFFCHYIPNLVQCWGQALSFAFADHRHATLGYNRYVAAGPPYRAVKTAGLNLPTFQCLHVCNKPD